MDDVSRNHRIAKIEAILARDLIDLADGHATDEHIMEAVSDLCFTLMRLFDELGNQETAIDWQKLFNTYDKQHYALQQGQPPEVNTEARQVYAVATRIITS